MYNCYVKAFQSDQSKYLTSYSWWDMGLFVSSSHTLESRFVGWHGNYVISHHENVLIVENNNILWHLGGPSDQTCTHKNCHKVQERSFITYLKPLNGNSFSLVFPRCSAF